MEEEWREKIDDRDRDRDRDRDGGGGWGRDRTWFRFYGEEAAVRVAGTAEGEGNEVEWKCGIDWVESSRVELRLEWANAEWNGGFNFGLRLYGLGFQKSYEFPT